MAMKSWSWKSEPHLRARACVVTVLVGLLAMPPATWAGTVTNWTGLGGDTSYGNVLNWDNGVPASGYDAMIASGFTVDLQPDFVTNLSPTVNSMTISSGSTLNVNTNNVLTMGTASNGGVILSNGGTLNLQQGGSVEAHQKIVAGARGGLAAQDGLAAGIFLAGEILADAVERLGRMVGGPDADEGERGGLHKRGRSEGGQQEGGQEAHERRLGPGEPGDKV